MKRAILRMSSNLMAGVLFLLVSAGAYAQTNQPTFKVRLEITADDDIKGRVTSLITRELRALHDVAVVEVNAQLEFEILVLKVHSVGGLPTGVILSAVVTKPFSNEHLADFVKGVRRASNDQRLHVRGEALILQTSGLSTFFGHWVQVGATERLRNLCEELVAQFDVGPLERARQEIRDARLFLRAVDELIKDKEQQSQ